MIMKIYIGFCINFHYHYYYSFKLPFEVQLQSGVLSLRMRNDGCLSRSLLPYLAHMSNDTPMTEAATTRCNFTEVLLVHKRS